MDRSRLWRLGGAASVIVLLSASCAWAEGQEEAARLERRFSPLSGGGDKLIPPGVHGQEIFTPPVCRPIGQGGLGHVEFVFRYSTLDLNCEASAQGTPSASSAVRGGDIAIWTGGLNSYLNPYAPMAFEAQHVELSRLSPSAAVYLAPLGAQVGQSCNDFAVRSRTGCRRPSSLSPELAPAGRRNWAGDNLASSRGGRVRPCDE